ncbi:LacI family DNA-binding transcriptional regulator [Marinomonas sp. TW1]|uniref:LacI family DNA-binding transcriptional regulator n=1 Tax=Marinomonas sp. TW1 TaxID=1561203 RepID=UPI0007AFB09C|nr:LacI family DNA-binding transcriptional regulator [Marinomonas sp. TW1]KZN12992.1 LacI family transcriptional regulator [Marinomonas sp. TW1]
MTTIYDVASAAGVSPKTVSRVLNNDAAVGEKTRLKVEASIEQLGYVPSTAARSMRSNKSGLIGLVTGAISDFSDVLNAPTGLPDLFIVQGIQKVMQASGKTLLIADTGGSPESVSHLVRTFQEHRVEGLIYVANHHKQVDLPRVSQNIHTVLANCFDANQTTSVVPNDKMGQYSLVDRIIRDGHSKIAYLTLDPSMVATDQRLEGYKQALQDSGINYDAKLVVCADTLDLVDNEALIIDAIDQLLALDSPPTAICCGNDKMALKLYGILRVRGIRIPEQISIAGYDNYLAITEGLYPPLTTVQLPYQEIGQEAARQLLTLIDHQQQDHSRMEKTEIDSPVIWRQSILKV